MIANVPRNEGATLDITAEAVKIRMGSNIVCSYRISGKAYQIKYHPTIHDMDDDTASTRVANVLGISHTRVMHVRFVSENEYNDMVICVSYNGCRITHGALLIHLSSEEAISTFVKLKELGYEVVRE
jgi:hypothetical protein